MTRNHLLPLLTTLFIHTATAAPASDLVTTLPGWSPKTWPFDFYSGVLSVPGPVAGYGELLIHYEHVHIYAAINLRPGSMLIVARSLCLRR